MKPVLEWKSGDSGSMVKYTVIDMCVLLSPAEQSTLLPFPLEFSTLLSVTLARGDVCCIV